MPVSQAYLDRILDRLGAFAPVTARRMFGGVGLFMYRAVTEWSRSGLGLLADALIIAIAVTGLNLITGYTGQISLAQMSFAGIGAFVMARMMADGIGRGSNLVPVDGPGLAWPIAGAIGIAAAVVVGIVVGLPAVRIRGVQLAVVTIAAAVALQGMYFENEVITQLRAGVPAGVNDGCAALQADRRKRIDVGCITGPEVTGKAGGPPSFNHGPKKLWWLHERTSIYRRIAAFVQPGGYAAMRLCGLDATGAFIDHTYLHFSGFGDNRRAAWDADLCRAFGLDGAKQGAFPRILVVRRVVPGIVQQHLEKVPALDAHRGEQTVALFEIEVPRPTRMGAGDP